MRSSLSHLSSSTILAFVLVAAGAALTAPVGCGGSVLQGSGGASSTSSTHASTGSSTSTTMTSTTTTSSTGGSNDCGKYCTWVDNCTPTKPGACAAIDCPNELAQQGPCAAQKAAFVACGAANAAVLSTCTPSTLCDGPAAALSTCLQMQSATDAAASIAATSSTSSGCSGVSASFNAAGTCQANETCNGVDREVQCATILVGLFGAYCTCTLGGMETGAVISALGGCDLVLTSDACKFP